MEGNPLTVPVTLTSAWPSRLRSVLIGAFAVAIALTAIGCKARTVETTGTTGATEASAVAPSDSASPAPAGQALLTLSGKGDKTSDTFAASGESVDVTYAYTCAAPGSFTLNFYGTHGSPALPDVLVDDFGDKGGDTTTESLNGAPGPFHLDVVTACDWSIEVAGAP